MHLDKEQVHEMGQWWKHKAEMPTTMYHKNNYVLYPAELADYAAALAAMVLSSQKELARVQTQLRAMEKGFVPMFAEPLQPPHTLCDVMEFMCAAAKAKLAIMKCLVGSSERFVNSLGDRNELRTQPVVSDKPTDA